MREEETAEFENVYCEKETAKALLVRINGKSAWCPKSVIHDDSEVFDEDRNRAGKLVVKQWWADKEGLT